MFTELFLRKKPYIVWTIPENERVYVSHMKHRQCHRKNVQFRTFLETIEYLLTINETVFSTTLKTNLKLFIEACDKVATEKQKKMITISRDGEWKMFSWKKEISYIQEVLFSFQETKKCITPVIYISDRKGGPAILPYVAPFFKLDSVVCVEKQTNDPEIIVCSVCMNNKKNILFSPCQHVTCCARCAEQVSICPICREKIKQTTLVFL